MKPRTDLATTARRAYRIARDLSRSRTGRWLLQTVAWRMVKRGRWAMPWPAWIAYWLVRRVRKPRRAA